MPKIRTLQDDGLELLGEIAVGPTLVFGDPSALLAPVGTGSWAGVAVRPGKWHVFGRPYRQDPDQLEEIVLAHEGAVPDFYDLYDAAVPVVVLPMKRGRLAVLDGSLRLDEELLRSAYEPDAEALPWLLEQGFVVAGIGTLPASVVAPKAAEIQLVAIGLAAAPEQVPTTPFVKDNDEDGS